MLMHTVVVHDHHVTGRPVVPLAVVDLVADAVENVERRFVHVSVLLRLTSGAVFLEMDMEQLADAVLRLDVMTAIGLGPVYELDFRGLAHPWLGTKTHQLLAQVVLAFDRSDEDTVLLAVVKRSLSRIFVVSAAMRGFMRKTVFVRRCCSVWKLGDADPFIVSTQGLLHA